MIQRDVSHSAGSLELPSDFVVCMLLHSIAASPKVKTLPRRKPRMSILVGKRPGPEDWEESRLMSLSSAEFLEPVELLRDFRRGALPCLG